MDNASNNAQNVISMTQYLPETGFAALSQTEAYWEALRAGRLLPKRSEIDPRGIESALENAFIIERIATGIARLRVAGSHLNDLMGMEVRGMPLTTFFAPTHRRLIADALEEMFQTPAVCTLDMTAPATSGRPALEAKLILLPLKSDLGDVSRALGCLVAKGEIGAVPRRFDVTDHKFEPLIPGGIANPNKKTELPTPQPAPAPQQGFAEDKSSFAPKRNKRPPYLRLVKSDES